MTFQSTFVATVVDSNDPRRVVCLYSCGNVQRIESPWSVTTRVIIARWPLHGVQERNGPSELIQTVCVRLCLWDFGKGNPGMRLVIQ